MTPLISTIGTNKTGTTREDLMLSDRIIVSLQMHSDIFVDRICESHAKRIRMKNMRFVVGHLTDI